MGRKGLDARDKGAVILGMVIAFQTTKWPKHFNKEDKSMWKMRANTGRQILEGGAFNPRDVWAMEELFDDEMQEQL